MASNIPSSRYYQYFSHLFHSRKMIPWNEYEPQEDWNYPTYDQNKFEKLFLQDVKYYEGQHIIDIGCHHGYMSYIAKTLGASSVHGINARQHPLDVANFAFEQLNMSDYLFEKGNIENNVFLKEACQGKDTMIFSETIEHLRNPYLVLETISNSTIQNLVFSCSVSIESDSPQLKYYTQNTNSDFTAYDEDKKIAVACYPNVAWIDMVLYHLGWKIEHYEVVDSFNKEWFAVPDLETFTPKFSKNVYILATKFDSTSDKDNYEHER